MQEMIDDEEYLTARSNQSTVGTSLFVFLISMVCSCLFLSAVAKELMPENLYKTPLVLILISLICQYAIALPISFSIMRNVPVAKASQFTMTTKQFIGFFAVSYPIIFVGNYIGTFLSYLLSDGYSLNRVEKLALSSGILQNILFFVIIAPIIEEFIFRKLILDRLRMYGEKRAIVFSALAFALFHMNLFQFFYTFGVGLLFGYMYVRTSRLRYSILLHMIINLQGSVIPILIMRQLVNANGKMININKLAKSELSQIPLNILIIGFYGMFMLGMLIFGIVILARCKHYLVFFEAPNEISGSRGTKALYGSASVISFIVIGSIFTILMLFAQ